MNPLLPGFITIMVIIIIILCIILYKRGFNKRKVLAAGTGLMIVLSGIGIILGGEPPAAPVYGKFGMQTAYTGTGGIGGIIRYFTATNCTSSGAVKQMYAYVITTNLIKYKIKCALYAWISDTQIGSRLATCTEQSLTGDSLALTWTLTFS